MTYTPVIEFCKQRLSDLGATTLAGTTPLARPADSDKRAIVELQMVITLCEGLNKQEDFIRQNLEQVFPLLLKR